MLDGKLHDDGQKANAELLAHRGVQFQLAGQYDAAKVYYQAALGLDSTERTALSALPGILYLLRKFDAAVALGRRAVSIYPGDAVAHANLGVALASTNNFLDAARHTRRALEIESKPEHHFNWGNILYAQNHFGDAAESIAKAIAGGVDNQDCINDYSLSLMAKGELNLGLEWWECRWNTMPKSPAWRTGAKPWTGEPLNGKSILVHHEQGFGDSIMLSRFLNALCDLSARVSFAVPHPLVRLMMENFSGVNVVDLDGELPKTDFHSPALSVVRHLRLEPRDISSKPYLGVREKTPLKLPGRGLRVGLCWTSGDHGPVLQMRRRVIDLKLFLPLLEIPGIDLISLQKGGPEVEILNLGVDGFIFDAMDRCADFYDTAAIIRELDLVISVDSAVAHLAGAMGKHVVMLGPYTRCWRWWNTPSGLPWYENIRILTQVMSGSWEPPVRNLIQIVRKLVATRRP